MKKQKIERIRSKANGITAKYSGWIRPAELQEMYRELHAIGVTVGLISGGRDRCEWYINGTEIETSDFVYQVYKGAGAENEYNIYFS